jgi:hypothetical protein
MAKFPSQRKMLYQTGTLSNDTYTLLTSGGVSGDLNLPKDLSLLNRRGYASTTRKGVPLVYQCKVDFYLHDEDGQGASTALGADLQATLKIDGVQNNWVMRNAAVKFHAAREEMMRKAGIPKGHRGSYSHEIRYNYDANDDTWLVPIDGDGDAFTGGTWDVTKLSTEDDTDMQLRLIGAGVDESSAVSVTALNIGHSYLQSRARVQDDTNVNADSTPGKFSVLVDMLSDGVGSFNVRDDIQTTVRGEQDNPPYENTAAGASLNHDITEPVELGRAIAGFGNAYGSVIVDIPFGLAKLRGTVFDAADTNVTPSGLVCVEVLDIFEMQG